MKINRFSHDFRRFFDKPSPFSVKFAAPSCSSYCEGTPSLFDLIPFYREENVRLVRKYFIAGKVQCILQEKQPS